MPIRHVPSEVELLSGEQVEGRHPRIALALALDLEDEGLVARRGGERVGDGALGAAHAVLQRHPEAGAAEAGGMLLYGDDREERVTEIVDARDDDGDIQLVSLKRYVSDIRVPIDDEQPLIAIIPIEGTLIPTNKIQEIQELAKFLMDLSRRKNIIIRL